MEILNKISELVSEGYTVCFKSYPGGRVYIELTYDNFYHANHLLAHLDVIKQGYDSDCVVTILDCLKHKIEQQKEYWDKKHGSD